MRIVVAVLALALAVCTAGCDGGPSSATNPEQSTGTTSTSSGTSQASSGTTRASSGSTHAAPGSSHLSQASSARIVSWYHGRGGAGFISLTKALDRTSRAEVSGTAAFVRACPQLASAVTAAQGGPPIPAATASKWYKQALAKYQQSAAVCRDGASTDDAGVLHQAEAEVAAANVDLNRAAAILITALSHG